MALDVTGNVSELDKTGSIVETPLEETDDENKWSSSRWSEFNGYYKNHNPVKGVINKLALWSVGRGFTADTKTTEILRKVIGWGKDSFEDVADNNVRVRHINGDSYSEIITTDDEPIAEDGSNLLNLKPLDPGKMSHITTKQGQLIRYEMTRKENSPQTFKPHEIFHLILNRDADEVHGTGDIESITTYLDKIKQLDEDMSILFHKFVVPTILFKLNTDNTTKIADLKKKMDKALNTQGNIYIPQGAVEFEIVEAKERGQNATDWRRIWVDEIVRSGGVPALIMAQEAGSTEASSKMVVFTWEQTIRNEQQNFERQFENQVNLKIKLIPPKSIEDSVKSDEKKDGNIQGEKKSEVTAKL